MALRYRRDLLRLYVMALLADGEFSGLKSVGLIGSRVTAMFATDLPAVLEELATLALSQGAQHASDRVQSAIAQAIASIQRDGTAAVVHRAWKSVASVFTKHNSGR